MEILSDTRFCLKAIDSNGENGPPRSKVFFKGQSTGISIPGAVLECAASLKEYYVLFTTDDIPQEDTLHICLLNDGLRLLDYANVGAMYSTGHLSDLRIEEPDKIHFRFIGDTTWTLRIADKPSFHMPVLRDPKGVSRPIRFSTYLQLEAEPHPEAG